MAKLVLTIAGKFREQIPVQIPLFNDLDMFEKYRAREEYVEAEKIKFRLMHLREIIKAEFDYTIELLIFSTKI